MILAKSSLSFVTGSAVIAAAIGYLIGSLPTAGLLGRLGGVHLRNEGSGNPGAHNALRTSGPLLAALILLVEASKGYLAVRAGDMIMGDVSAVAAGIGAVAGNVYNLWYRFDGGKGLGISLGVLAGLWPAVLVPLVAVMVVAVSITRSSGLTAMVGLAALTVMALLWPVYGWPTGGVAATGHLIVITVGIGAIIFRKHHRDARFRAPVPR